MSGNPATVKVTSLATAATRWFKRPSSSTKRRVTDPSGTTPKPISLLTTITRPLTRVSSASNASSRAVAFASVGTARCGDVGHRQSTCNRETFRISAFARAGTADHEGKVNINHGSIVSMGLASGFVKRNR